MARIRPRLSDAKGLVTHPRSQAASDPVPTIVLLTGAIIAVQAAKALRAGQAPVFDQHAAIVDAALIGGFVLAATFIPSDLVIAVLLVVLLYDLIVDPSFLADLVRNVVSRVPTGG